MLVPVIGLHPVTLGVSTMFTFDRGLELFAILPLTLG